MSETKKKLKAIRVAKTSSTSVLYLRNLIFGVEDSLVSTVGLLSGVAIAGVDKATILLTGAILIFVEGFSMGVGSFLSEESAEKLVNNKKSTSRKTVPAALIMFFSYFVSGFIPLFPYIIFGVSQAFFASILVSLIALFLLGALSARYYKKDTLKYGLRMLTIGGGATIIGAIVGKLLNL